MPGGGSAGRARARGDVFAERVNAAADLLDAGVPAADAARELASRFGCSPRQAHRYVQRAGRLYSWALRLFLLVVPAVAGVVQPLSLVPATLALLMALHFFDQPAAVDFDIPIAAASPP